MKTMIGLYANHDLSNRMFRQHKQRGHYAVFNFDSLERQTNELNIGRRMKVGGRDRVGQMTRPLCNSPFWRPLSLFETPDNRRAGGHIVRFVRRRGRPPIGMKDIKQMLELDDQMRFPGADPMPAIVHGVHYVQVSKNPPDNFCHLMGEPYTINRLKSVFDEYVAGLLRQNKIKFTHHF